MREAPAALKERFACEVEEEAPAIVREVRHDAHVGCAAVDARTPSGEFAEAVADRILDAQRREVDALERAARRARVDAKRYVGTEPALPLRRAGNVVNIAAVPVFGVRDTHQNAACKTRMQARGHREARVARKLYAAAAGAHEIGIRAERENLVCEQRLESEGANSVKGKGRHVGVSSWIVRAGAASLKRRPRAVVAFCVRFAASLSGRRLRREDRRFRRALRRGPGRRT